MDGAPEHCGRKADLAWFIPPIAKGKSAMDGAPDICGAHVSDIGCPGIAMD